MDASYELAQPAPDPTRTERDASEGLSGRDARILDFEQNWWRHAGSKEQAIRDGFGLSPTRYYQLLNALLDNPAAMESAPMLVKRLRRLRASRSRARSMHRLGVEHER
jgi:hypothetical protein